MIRRALHSALPCQDVGRHLTNFSQDAREVSKHMSDGEILYRRGPLTGWATHGLLWLTTKKEKRIVCRFGPRSPGRKPGTDHITKLRISPRNASADRSRRDITPAALQSISFYHHPQTPLVRSQAPKPKSGLPSCPSTHVPMPHLAG